MSKLLNKIGQSVPYNPDAPNAKRKLERIKKDALKLHALTGSQYHIVEDESGLMIINNKWLKWYNKNCDRSRRFTHKQVLENALYSTPSQRLVKLEPKESFFKRLLKRFKK